MTKKVIIVVDQEDFDTLKEFAVRDQGRVPQHSFSAIVFRLINGAKVIEPQPRTWYSTLLNRWGVR